VDWLQSVEYLREHRRAGVLVTLTAVRGHAPREPGAKMVVAADRTWGSIGGGNLEAVAVSRARRLLQEGRRAPETLPVSLSEKASAEYGVQCCGGEVTVLLEPLPVPPVVAVFGIGHVGLELARILSRLDLDLHLVDTRPDQLSPERLAVLADARARVHVHRDVPVLPEIVLPELPRGAHVLVMTHDHAEDAALCDAALRCAGLGSIGLIGSAAKWARFRARLTAEGHAPEAIDRITTPIGLPGISGKDPATIAVSIAAALIHTFERDRADAGDREPARP
jgi:xanthine dehydrogenase accessory factor